jgi:bifunctional DNase/RNase
MRKATGFIAECGAGCIIAEKKVFQEGSAVIMIEVNIDSIRVSLMSQHRVVVLKDVHDERYLPIWIGPCEAESITVRLQDTPAPRPLTHDLLRNVIQEMGGTIRHILISDLRNEVYYARIVVAVGKEEIDIDSRPSDALALAVRAEVPIYVSESVMDKAGTEPEEDLESEMLDELEEAVDEKVDSRKLSAFADFVDTLNFDELDDKDD